MKIIVISLFTIVVSILSAFSENEGRAEMEKHLLPFMKQADRIEILSLYPWPKDILKEQSGSSEVLIVFGIRGDKGKKPLNADQEKIRKLALEAPEVHGYPVLGKVTVEKKEDVNSLLHLIRGNMIAKDDGEEESADCHDPRHAIRIITGEKVVCFSICFACSNTYIREAPKEAEIGVKGFYHFKDDLKPILEKYFDDSKVIYVPEVINE